MKNNKIFSFISLPLLMTLLAGCEVHEHTFSEVWSSDENKHWHAATCEHQDVIDAEGLHVDEDSNGKCDVCNHDVEVDIPHSHEFSGEYHYDDNNHWQICSCGEKGNVGTHTFGEDGVCSVCGYKESELPPIQHTHQFEGEFLSDENNHWQVCSCGEKGNVGTHTFDKDGKCTICGYEKSSPEITYTVTKEEWLASNHTEKPFMFADNYQLHFNMNMGEVGRYMNYEVDNGKVKATSNMQPDEYYSYENSLYFKFTGSDADGWNKTNVRTNPVLETYGMLEAFGNPEAFTFNELTHTYEAESLSTLNSEIQNASINFENKAIVRFEFDSYVDSQKTALVHSVVNIVYGGQSVTLPTISEHVHTFSSAWTYDETNHWHEATCEHTDVKGEMGSHVDANKDGFCDVCSYSLIPDPINYEVNAKEWEEAFGLNYLYDFSDNFELYYDAVQNGKHSELTIQVDSKIAKLNAVSQGESLYAYVAEVNGAFYIYDKDYKGEWYKDDYFNIKIMYETYFLVFYNMSDFTFDSSRKIYVADSLKYDGLSLENLEIQFKDKKISYISFDVVASDSMTLTGENSFVALLTYGGQQLELPTVHEHTFSSEWEKDDVYHWHNATCGHSVTSKKDYHEFGDDDICDICGYQIPVDCQNFVAILNDEHYYYFTYDEKMDQWELKDITLNINDTLEIVNNVDGDFQTLSNLTIGESIYSDDCGFAISKGVLTSSRDSIFSFYLWPEYGNDQIFPVDEGIVDNPVYGYTINDAGYVQMNGPDKANQWTVIDVNMVAGETITFANIEPEEPEVLTSLSIGGEDQGFTIDAGVLTATKDGLYSFYLCPEFENDLVYIADNSPVEHKVSLMGSIDDWTDGIEMLPTYEESSEFVASELTFKAGDLIKVKDDSDYCSTWKLGGNNNALDLGIVEIDAGGSAKFLVDAIVNVYYESAVEGGQGYGTFVELIKVISPYTGTGSYLGESHTISFDFDEIENGYAQYYANIPNGYVNSDFIYTIKKSNESFDLEVEQFDEGVNFFLGKDEAYHYSGVATALDLYLKVKLDGSGTTLYVADSNQEVASNFQIVVNGSAFNLSENKNPVDPSFTEWYIIGLHLEEDDIIRFLDNTGASPVAFDILNIDTASVSNIEIEGSSLKCNSEGDFDIYLKLKYQNDQIYIGYSSK